MSPLTNGGPGGGKPASKPVVVLPIRTLTFPPLSGVGKTPFTDPTAPLTSATGIEAAAVIGVVPTPFK